MVGTRADGTVIRRPVDEIVRFESDRGHWAVKIIIPRKHVEAFGAERMALAIDGRVALAPQPLPGYPTPQTDTDIDAAVTAFINSPDSVIGHDEDKPAGDLWRKTFGSDALDRPVMQKAAAYF